MSLPELLRFPAWVLLIDLGGAGLIVGYGGAALLGLARGHGITRARLLVAQGAVLGLSFKVAGTLVKTLELHTWEQIARFGTVLALRTLLKWLFTWESARLGERH